MSLLSRSPLSGRSLFAVEYEPRTNEVVLLEQRALPDEVVYLRLARPDDVVRAIRDMSVRGAPAIGITAAYGLALVASQERGDARAFLLAMGVAGRIFGASRPTAVNLAWAIARVARVAADVAAAHPDDRAARVLGEAEAIHREDVLACERMAELGAAEVPDGATVLTHCNAGALATGGMGTALGVVRRAHALGKLVRVLANETRPYLQGARITAFELSQDGVPVEILTDASSGHYFARGEIGFVVVGADRIARNGDVANKIGTYTMAVLADAHHVPFTVAAPTSTLDLATASGAEIPIEERASDEVALVRGVRIAPAAVHCRHPAFDVTPARLVHAVYTERGVVRPRHGVAWDLLR